MRMIDRWFPCAAVSEAAYQSHGSGLVEKSLFTWFAARPIAQARAAILTTLLPWPEERTEQRRLQDLVTRAISGDMHALSAIAAEVRLTYPDGARVLDPFSGRAMIPLEAARAGAEAWGIDYSPVATLGGMLLADFPFRDWSSEPPLPFNTKPKSEINPLIAMKEKGKLLSDVRIVFDEISRRYEQYLDGFYPKNAQGDRPWGYLWAQTMPCDECRHHFPLVGSTILRERTSNDLGACFSFVADRSCGEINVIIHEGIDSAAPTLLSLTNSRGKIARCPFCDHPHSLDIIKAKANTGLLHDKLLIVADLNSTLGQVFRLPSQADIDAVLQAEKALQEEKPFRLNVPAVPDEPIPAGNNHTVRASLYGVHDYGGMCCDRQTLNFVRLCRIITDLKTELQIAGCTEEYIRALLGYAGAILVRKLRYSTRGTILRPTRSGVDHIFKNQASLNYGFDFFECGIGNGPGTWRSLVSHTFNVLEKLARGPQPLSSHIRQGSALHLPFRPKSVSIVVTTHLTII